MNHTPAASTIPVDLDALPPDLAGGVVAIGNFDGVHRGHQAVLTRALELGRPAVALTFEPHPRTYFSAAPLFRLTPAPLKARAIAALGLDATVVAPFDARLATMPAEAFVAEVLVGRLAVATVVVGYDFHFGARRGGNPALLERMGPDLGFAVTTVPPLSEAGEAVSSSLIRNHLAAGELDAAAALLGWRFRVSAPVIHGEKRGRVLGYPTANQALDGVAAMRHGIYAVRARIDGVWRDGVASFGRRPMFDNGAPLLETFVFDWSGDLYGRTLEVMLVRFLRPELKFDGLDALVAQMDRDSADARAALAGLQPVSPLDAALCA